MTHWHAWRNERNRQQGQPRQSLHYNPAGLPCGRSDGASAFATERAAKPARAAANPKDRPWRRAPGMAGRWLALWLGLCLTGLAGPARAIEVVHAEFGVFAPRKAASGEAGKADELTLEPARIIPRTPGTRYGWAIELRTDKRRVSVREEYLLPTSAPSAKSPARGQAQAESDLAPPAGGETRTLAFERRNTVSQRQLVPRNGLIFGEWEIGPGEPPGRRHLQVIVDGELAADFEYEVRAQP